MHAKTDSTPKSRTTFMKLLIRYRTMVILIVLMAVFSLLRPVFINPANLLAILKNMSYVLIVGLGMTFIITLGGLDLSVGSIAAVVGVTFALLVRGPGTSHTSIVNRLGPLDASGFLKWIYLCQGKD